MKKNIKLLMIIGAMIIGVSSSAIAGEQVTKEEANAIADVRICEFTDTTSEEMGEVTNTYELYDKLGNISAYYFQYSDAYIIIGANTQYYPVIEYSDDNESFISKAIAEYVQDGHSISDIKIYYTGGINYYIGTDGNNNVKSINSQDGTECNVSSLELSSPVEKSEWYINTTESMGMSTTPINVIITNPNSYESQYYSKTVKNVPNYNITYFSTSNFSGYKDHCSPTAATNLAKYWYVRNNSKYNKLLVAGSWANSFKKFYNYFGTTPGIGTYNSKLGNGFYMYFRDCGISLTKNQYISNPTISILKKEIDDGYPFEFCLLSHKLYGDHHVLALGYVTYIYRNGNTLTNSDYIRVADGWCNNGNRYVKFAENEVKYGIQIVRPA